MSSKKTKFVPVPAVKYCGAFADWTGYGEANRNAISALNAAGVEMTTERISYTHEELSYGKTFDLAASLEGLPLDYDIKIIHIPSDGYVKHLEPTKYHIGHLFWETDSLSKTWVWNCNLMDEIWTGAESHKENFMRAGVKVPIYVFPQAIDTSIRLSKPFQIPRHEGFLFYSIFQWIERKDPKSLLTAYWQEFESEKKVTLLLKVYGKDLSSEEFQRIRNDIKKWKTELNQAVYPRTLIYTDMLSREDMMRLHMTGDCFVSAHRGEGWGIPQVESLLVGNPIISTNKGGVHELLEDRGNAHLVKWKETNVFNMEFAPWYDPNQKWAQVDIKDLRARMREVFDNPSKARSLGVKGRKFVHDNLSYEAVGQQMADRLRSINRLIK